MRTKIYFLRDENGFVKYVGKTCGTLERRLGHHVYDALRGDLTKKCNGIRAMLRRGFSPTIDLITEVRGDGVLAEQAYIKWLRSKGISLWNGTEGGDGFLKGHSVSQATRAKLSDSRKGFVPSEATRSLWSRQRRGHRVSEETKRRMSNSHIGLNTWSKGRISEKKGTHLSSSQKKKISASRLRFEARRKRVSPRVMNARHIVL